MARKILIMDDDDIMRDFLTFGLRNAGYEVMGAGDGKEGLQTAESFRPDILIVDLNMPVMHGFEVCQKVRENESYSGVKIVILSAKSYPADIKKAKTMGADCYLLKPVEIDKLLETVKAL